MKQKWLAIRTILFNENFVILTPSRLVSSTPRDTSYSELMKLIVDTLNKAEKKGKSNAKTKR